MRHPSRFVVISIPTYIMELSFINVKLSSKNMVINPVSMAGFLYFGGGESKKFIKKGGD